MSRCNPDRNSNHSALACGKYNRVRRKAKFAMTGISPYALEHRRNPAETHSVGRLASFGLGEGRGWGCCTVRIGSENLVGPSKNGKMLSEFICRTQ